MFASQSEGGRKVSDQAWPWMEQRRILNFSCFMCELKDVSEQDISNMVAYSHTGGPGDAIWSKHTTGLYFSEAL